ncbi:hypothetical protein EUTSA_v10026973mg [Eutrema salsugineum]|uniref:Neprosin PEP catalytic domain-containing protein n=1 Tax=Eutrema salsugineum TaxID=72664 RepID=V4MF05_EUTSA|nr:uncharacterized protein LOC18028576 [Eutrema salsugineum]ESQ55034.1 hypothetical protein EUTSA_v10026973mg [Eutrema salsugineum]
MKMEVGFSVMWMILLCQVLCCSIMIMSYNHGIAEAAETLKNVEDLEIEQKLKLINKPAVKIIKSIYGERYGCVDFYKQPGFDHPSMKNHTFHHKMRMMSYPNGSRLQRETSSNKTFGHFWENGIGCPIGTVPIVRVTKNDFLRSKLLSGDNSWNNTYEPMSPGSGYNFAVTHTKGAGRIYNGGSMNVAIWTPPVQPNQRSSARLKVQIGNEFIEAGWTVHPGLYGDAKSRLFVFTNAGGHACYNFRCPSGMILVRQDFSPGLPLAGKYVDIYIDILKDKINGQWWLYVAGEQVGFWPSDRFKESSGTMVEWGGAVYSPPPTPSPPMGNGHYPVGNPKIDSYIRKISIVDANYNTDHTVKNTKSHSSNSHGYQVRDAEETWWTNTGHLVIYGGPGKV